MPKDILQTVIMPLAVALMGVGGTVWAAKIQADVAIIDRSSIASVKEGQKLCSVVNIDKTGNWRDSFIVPKEWTGKMCDEYRKAVAASAYELGCVFADSVVIGNNNTPPRSCGW